MGTPVIEVKNLTKQFVLHTQHGAVIRVFENLNLTVDAGECVVLTGPSGTGKSTLLRALYANYKPVSGEIIVRHEGEPIDIAAADYRLMLAIRRRTIGYVSQFLRVIPRVKTIDLVAEPLLALEHDPEDARRRAAGLLLRLNIGANLWELPPATFSGGEQQRVNLARGFIHPYPVLLLDEPTASLDAGNRATVIDLIREARDRGAAIVGIFHDQEVRDLVADRLIHLQPVEKVM
ncbi:MAG: phosphonate C-P lyase system protein PhnL [Deltaproteobacteria bacterium]|nr:phosphonate C-P lyase system protein PhnL [Candidatus Anaeroferrophillacea bacterium]